MRRFGQIIRKARMEKKYSLSKLANLVLTYKGYICQIESGKLNPPSPKMVDRLCIVLDLNFQDMMALSIFEKLPKGFRFHKLKEVLLEAHKEGLVEAKGPVRIQI